MNLRRIWTIFLRQFFLIKRSPYRIFAFFYWPVIELVLWGFFTVYLSRAGGERLAFVSVLIGAIILFNFLTRIQHGITISFLEDVWVRNFINLFSSPLTVVEYILGLLLTSILQLVVSIGFMAILAWLVFAYNIFNFGFWLLPFVGILFLFGLALGVLVTAIILRLGPSSEILTWVIPAIISPLSGVFYPVNLFPKVLQWLAAIFPSTYVFEGMRNVVIGRSFDVGSILIAFLLGTLWLILASIFMRHVYKVVLDRGLFTKFMTE